MPKGSKKRKAAKRKKEELEAKIIAAEQPPEPNSQESSPVKEVNANAPAVLAKPTVNLSKELTQIENILPHGVLEFDPKEDEFSKGLPLVNELTSNVAETKENSTDADTGAVANLVEGVVLAENVEGQDILGVTDAGLAEDIVDQYVEVVMAEEMKQVLIPEDSAVQFEEAVIEDEMTQPLMAPGIGVQLRQIKEMVGTGMSIADSMKELFLMIMDDLNAILDA